MLILIALILLAASCTPSLSSGSAEGAVEARTDDSESPAAVSPGDPTPTPAPTLPAGPVDGLAACDMINDAVTGATVTLTGGIMEDFDTIATNAATGCDVISNLSGVTDVTVQGDWTGDVRCRNCNGWTFENVTVTSGSLRMIGGAGWTIRNSSFDGAARGIMAVLGTGGVGPGVYSEPNPRAWVIDNVESGNGGCRPAGDPFPTHVRALYVIGWVNSDMNGLVTNSTFRGWDCAVPVKIGGTGGSGACPGNDAADAVTFRGNTVITSPAPAGTPNAGKQPDGVLVAANSDNVTVDDNTISAARNAVVASGPFTGVNLVVTNNAVTSGDPWLLWAKLSPDCAAPFTFVEFESFTGPACPGLGTCSGNTLRPHPG
jgi:hypothetical protein